jgi:AAA15 family ATPase/GTPase
MALIEKISLANFKCYRSLIECNLNDSTFFIGPNNSGKSAVLKALHCFFDDNQFSSEFINKTELRSKAAGYNRSTIILTFNIEEVTAKTLRERLIHSFGKILDITKTFTYREKSQTIQIEFKINDILSSRDDLSDDINDFLGRFKVSYIHPQESTELLRKAQEKLKQRLLSNWGRHPNLSETLQHLQIAWSELKERANPYLSNGLTQNLQDIWPGCRTTVNLPEKIEEIIAISEISFASEQNQPNINLTSQGTGAQSTILFETHYLLDSDKTLHRGFYYPVWLVEEPESFLHADIILKLGSYLSSREWLENIQMFITTHSPLLIATSKKNASKINWCLLDKATIRKQDTVSKWVDDEIKEMGIVMGDPNFDIYFKTAESDKIIIIEDSREITTQKLIESGINVTIKLNGVSEERRYFDVLRAIDISLGRSIFFFVDNDDGIKEFRNVLEKGTLIETSESGFTKYKFDNNIYLIIFPEHYAVEELFTKHDEILESCANQIFNGSFTNAASDRNIPANLTRAHASIRNKTVNGLEEAKISIRNSQDVKDIFWKAVEDDKLKMDEALTSEIILLL